MLEKTAPAKATSRDTPKRPKKTISDRGLKALKPAAKGTTYDQMDSVVPGFGVRVSETGRKTFVLVARFPGSRTSDPPRARAVRRPDARKGPRQGARLARADSQGPRPA